MSLEFEKRVQVNKIIESQLPEYLVADFPQAVEFFRQYYISQEYQGSSQDLLSNLDRYIKVDNLVPEVITGKTTLTSDVSITETTITVDSTKGFPASYGLIKIDNEIITYTGKTDTTFTGCIRGFSGITGYRVGISTSLDSVNRENLLFEDTNAASHTTASTVTNLSVLFLQEFYKKLKKTFLPGLEDNTFAEGLDVGNFIKTARSFYQSKGIAESIKILFKVLFGVEANVIDLEERLIKPSSAEYIRREVIVAEGISGDPSKLVGQTIFKSTDLETNASVSEVEIITRDNKTYYKVSLFVGFSDRDLIQGIFTIPGKSKVLEEVEKDSTIVPVDTTIGFDQSGTFIVEDVDSNKQTVAYESKTVNQFFGCSGITNNIGIATDVRSNETIFGYEDGDLSKRVDLRITGVISKFVPDGDVSLVTEGQEILVKNVGEIVSNPETTQTYKQIFTNSWIYNTSSRYQVSGSVSNNTFVLLSKIDRSSLKIGDSFDITRRKSNKRVGGGIVKRIDTDYSFTADGINFIPNEPSPLGDYDIRRNLQKTTYNSANQVGIALSDSYQNVDGTGNVLSDILNVYVDGDKFGYVASNSLPSTQIDVEPVSSSQQGTGLSADTIAGISTVKFATETKFFTGDSVVYTTSDSSKAFSGLTEGESYFVRVLDDKKSIKLYSSINAIETDQSILISSPTQQAQPSAAIIATHTFTIADQYNKKIVKNPILRKFPLSQDLKITTKNEKPAKNIGLLIDGTQIRTNTSVDTVSYGTIEQTEVYNSGTGYDIANPPKVVVEGIVGIGTTALVEPIIKGSVEEILVEEQDFDVSKVLSVTLTGGNGRDCFLEPVTGPRFREVEFNSRDIFFNGGLDIQEETITFTGKHNFVNGQKVYYNNNGQNPIGITAFKEASTNVTEYLVNGAPYFVRVINPTRIYLFKRPDDALFGVTGINTIGFSTATTAAGFHKFRTESKNTLRSVKVLNPGQDFQYRKLPVPSSGISTSFDTINFKNHGFRTGDIVEYLTDGTSIEGLTVSTGITSTTNFYHALKIDNDSFRLTNAGIGATTKVDIQRGKYINLISQGTGYQIFKYPDIEITVNAIFDNEIGGSFDGKLTPIVTGEIIGTYTYDQGCNYGSTIINHKSSPSVDIQNGKDAEVDTVVERGRLIDVIVKNKGDQYNSLPILKIDATEGSGAILKPIISDGRLQDIIVINPGIGYSSTGTNVYVEPRGKNGLLNARVRELEIDNIKRENDVHLEPVGDNDLYYGVNSYYQKLRESFNDSGVDATTGIGTHSPLIGWAYDGNPIYGGFGYSDPDDISQVKRLESGYSIDTNWFDRPNEESGFFIKDYVFDGSGDLDEYNGRFCKTPEFPNGVYAYFATLDAINNPIYPYFIGKSYRLPFISENDYLNQSFDFNSSTLSRNTLPYKVNDRFADNDFIVESNEIISQKSVVESVTKGIVDSFQVLDGGKGYKVGDFTTFNNDGTNGSGARGQVDRIVGIGVSNIKTQLTTFENATFIWNSANEVTAHYIPKIELNDQDTVLVSGLSTSNYELNNSFKVGVSTDRIGLAKSMTLNNNSGGVTEDIYVNKIPNTVAIGGSLRVGDEVLKVLNLYEVEKIIRVQRFNTGIAHTFGSSIDVLNNSISIPVNSDYFESRLDDLVYLNTRQAVGLGTTSGSVVDYVVGETTKSVNIAQQSIYLPNHPFTSGQKVKFSKPLAATSLLVSRDDDASNQFYIPDQSSAVSELYVIDKGPNNIGLATNVGAAKSESGLFFYGNADDNYQYLIKSDHTKLTGNIDRIISTVTTQIGLANTTTHGLHVGDIIDLEVNPNTVVGLGSTAPLTVSVNETHAKLLINSLGFEGSDVDIIKNQITISDHGLKTGDKVFYESSDPITGVTSSYYVNVIDSNKINLCETLNDSLSDAPQIVKFDSAGSGHSISLINPPIRVVKNANLTFGMGSTSLPGYELKFFYDKEFKNEFKNATKYDPSENIAGSFTISGVGTVGVGTFLSSPNVGAAVSIGFSTAVPSKLYYALEKGGYISTADTDVLNYSEITFVDSSYSGEFRVFDVDDETFKISPRSVPEVLTYESDQCDVLEYSSKSKTVSGAIKSIKLISEGFSYKSVPGFTSVTSVNGENANIVALSTSIGRVNNLRIIDIGFEYSSDKTLRPEAYIPPIVRVDDLDVIENITIVDGGTDYLNPPDLILFNPESKEVVDTTSLECFAPYQSISDVNVIAPIKGLNSVNHRVIAINNSNGIGIVSMTTNGTLVRCVMETPINGYVTPPFAVNDEIFVEGIQLFGEDPAGIGTQQSSSVGVTTISGDGYNSSNYDYRFFKVSSYSSANPDVLEFDLVGLTTNPGIAKTYQSGYANVVNRNNYPTFETNQKRSDFALGENLLVKEANSFVIKDIIVKESREDFIKIQGLDNLTTGDRITGESSGTSATVIDVISSPAKFNVDFSSIQNLGWNDNIGKLSEDFQVIPNNDYFQNLSYSIQSEKTWEDFVDPVNRLVHPSGLKNFADTVLTTNINVGIGSTFFTTPTLVLDVVNERRVDTVNNFDLGIDFYPRDRNSKTIDFQNVKLTDYTKCKTNRVLLHDDISGRFSSKGSQDLFTEIEEINANYARYFVQIVDPDSFDVQVSDLIVLSSTDNAYLLEKTTDFTGIRLGDFEADVDFFNRKTLQFTPTEAFNKDHDIKIIKTTFNTDVASTGVKDIGSVELVGTNVSVAVGRTTFSGSISGDTLTTNDFDLTSKKRVNGIEIKDINGNTIPIIGAGTTLSGPGVADRTEILNVVDASTAKLRIVDPTSPTNQPTLAPIQVQTLASTDQLGFVGSEIGRPAIPIGVTTTTIREFSETDCNAFYANVVSKDNVTGELDYTEALVNVQGQEVSISQLYADLSQVSFSQVDKGTVGLLTASYDSGVIKFDCINERNSDLIVSANIVGLGTTTAGIGTYRFNLEGQPAGAERSARYESTYNSTTLGVGVTVASIDRDIDSTVRSIVKVSYGSEFAIHQPILLHDQNNDAVTVQYPHVGSQTGLGTFGSETTSNDINLIFYPDSSISGLIEVQSFNEVLYTFNDFVNEPTPLQFGPVTSDLLLSSYDGINGTRGNKVNFNLTYQGIPVYSKKFNPSDSTRIISSAGAGTTFSIPNHFFNTNEEIEYAAGSTFIGVPAVSVGIAATLDADSNLVTTMPSKVFVKVKDSDSFQLFSRKEYIENGTPIEITSSGSGNAHKLNMTKVLSKTVIGLDGIVQQPITYTSIKHSLTNNIGIGNTFNKDQFAISGISSVQPLDVIKIDNEYMKVEQVGFTTLTGATPFSPINSTDGDIPEVLVARGSLGSAKVSHAANAEVRIFRGSFNIIDSTAWFLSPPKGNTRARRNATNIPYVKAEYNGRTFLRSNYDTNMVFDDISDSFTGIGRTYTLTVGGANTSSGVSVGNGIVFINGVFQTPLTLNNLGNNYEIEANDTTGISSVTFTGISSENGQLIQSEFDINQNQLPRGGLIVSMGSTPGVGYAPLVGARLLANSTNGVIDSVVSIASSIGPIGSGIETAHYDAVTGIITVTTNKVHGFALESPETVKLEGLHFTCPTYAIGTPTTGTTYNPSTGDMVITIANHGLNNGDAIKLEEESITFSCGYNGATGAAAEKAYPRKTDPAYDRYMYVSDVTTNTFKVNVLFGVTPTNTDAHTFVSATPNAVLSLNYVGVTTSIFQDHERSLPLVGVSSERSFQVNVGINSIPHTYLKGGDVYAFYDELTPGSGYREPVSIGVTDINYLHKFISASTDAITAYTGGFMGQNLTPLKADYNSETGDLLLTTEEHGIETAKDLNINTASYNATTGVLTVSAGSNYDVSDATYNPTTGNMVLTIGTHTLTTNDKIKLAPNSITFSCGFGGATGAAAQKSYPRSSGTGNPGGGADPAYDTFLDIIAVDLVEKTITVKVLSTTPSTNTDPHTFVSATAGAVFAPRVFINNEQVKFADNAITFRCTMDNNSTDHVYPRSTDPARGKFLLVSNATATQFEVNVGTSPLVGHTPTTGTTYDPTTGLMVLEIGAHSLKAGTSVRLEEESITFSCGYNGATGAAAEKAYPRSNGNDPYYNTAIPIQSVTATTITLQVLTTVPSTNTDAHTFVSATANAVKSGGGYTHTYASSIPNAVTATKSLKIEENSLIFKCSKDNFIGTHPYPRATDPAYDTFLPIISASQNTLLTNVGPGGGGGTGAVVTAIVAPNRHKFINSIGTHTFVDAISNAIDVGGVKRDVNNAVYVPGTGLLTLTIGNHSFTTSDTVTIAPKALTFTCDADNHGSNHSYPRSTDPAYNTALAITAVTAQKITCDVGIPPQYENLTADVGGPFTTNVADYDPKTGIMTVTTSAVHGFTASEVKSTLSAVYNPQVGIMTVTTTTAHGFSDGDYVKIAQDSIVFTCEQDAYKSEHSYPRRNDPINYKWVQISNTTVDKFDIQVLSSVPSTNISSHTFVSSLPNNIQKANNRVKFDIGSLVFQCNKDQYSTNHLYPRTTDPTYNEFIGVESVLTTKKFTVNVGTSPAGTGGALEFTIENGGSGYINPEIIVPQPVYENMPVTGVSRLGIGKTTDTGENLLLNLNVGSAKTTVGIGSTLFEISEFKIAREGHSFKVGDRLKPINLVTSAELQEPLTEFELEVVQIFNDYFSAWQFGEIDFIDTIRNLQNNVRKRFPLFFNGQLLSFEKDETDVLSADIDLNSVLVIFVNGVLQTPGIAYQFTGGATFTFTEPPDTGDQVDIFFYLGQRGIDVEIVDIQETIKPGDDLRIRLHNELDTVSQNRDRTVKEILSSDLVETDIYTGPGVNEIDFKPVDWSRQKDDKIIQGEIINKDRESIEPCVYPTAKIISDVSSTSGIGLGVQDGIFVDDAEIFFYEEGPLRLPSHQRYNITVDAVDTIMMPAEPDFAPADVTLGLGNNVGTANSEVTTYNIANGGKGYTSLPTVKISSPGITTVSMGVTATAEAVITNGSLTSLDITNPGQGYNVAPQIIIETPSYQTEDINLIKFGQGFTGIITGIGTAVGTGGHPLALEFFFNVTDGKQASLLQSGYPILIKDTSIGDGVTSVDSHDTSLVGIGTTFLDNIYKVHSITVAGDKIAKIRCNILSTTSVVGLASTGQYLPSNTGVTTSLGKITWGRLYGDATTREANPISIGVTGLTIDAGLSTFPTIQRRNNVQGSVKGLRNTGALRIQVI